MSVVTFRPIGRLGNNMFQVAACIGYAKRYGMKYLVPTRRGSGDTDPYLIQKFWPNLPYGDWNAGDTYEQHNPSMFNYAPIPHFRNGVRLVGFFQSEKWFENAKEEVRAEFPLKHYPEYEGYVSIHVRRGDYVTNANSFPPVGNEYLFQAIGKQAERSNKFIFFSDDIEWCKQLVVRGITYSRDGEFISKLEFEFNEDQNEHEAISKMASCSHHIIANSTFSWWAAYLGFNPDRIVVSPSSKNWFGSGFTGSEPTDLIPEKWIQIKY